MKKLNNKGFAISTLIYGLAIMGIMIVAILMATMAKTRSNNSNIVRAIEEDLNRFSKTQTSFKDLSIKNSDQNNRYVPISQEYIVPAAGWYKIELWGAQGGNNGGKGAYTSGIIELRRGDTLYFYVGKYQNNEYGGTATEVRIESGAYNDPLSYKTSIMVAAGGGTDSTANGGTLYGYNEKMLSYGGFINVKENGKDFSLKYRTETQEQGNNTNNESTDDNTNGSLVGFDKNYELSDIPKPELMGIIDEEISVIASHLGSNGGGDGYFSSDKATTGGASYIAGYAGCHGMAKNYYTINPKFTYHEHTYKENSALGGEPRYKDEPSREYYFVDGMMLPGVKTGDGYAKIERVLSKDDDDTTLERRNTKLDNVKYIRDCSDNGEVKQIIATKNGTILTGNLYTQVNNNKCVIFELDENNELNASGKIDEIVVFHSTSGIDYKNDKISVSNDANNWIYLKGTSTNDEPEISETETITGYRISAYQNDTIEPLKTGNYIIQPVLSDNKVITAAASTETNADPITIEEYVGEKRQKWSIEIIRDKKISPGYNPDDPTTYEYKITELARYKALTIAADENVLFNNLVALKNFNEKSRNEPQIWKITPLKDGTYAIETVVEQVNTATNTGYLTAQTNSTLNQSYNQIVIGKKNKETAKFKLIQVDYGGN